MTDSILDTKTARHEAIVELIEAHHVSSQEQLRRLLADLGFETAQATLSRDLSELQAVKVKTASGRSVYSIPDVNGRHVPLSNKANPRLARWCQDLLVSAQQVDNQLVLRTPVGAANLLSSSLDAARLDGVLGTLAGDDTILVICKDSERAGEVRTLLSRLAKSGA